MWQIMTKIKLSKLKEIHTLVTKVKGGKWMYSGTSYTKAGEPHTSVFTSDKGFVSVHVSTLKINEPQKII